MPHEYIFYSHPRFIAKSSLKIVNDEFRHLLRVLRKNVGDQITVVDGTGNVYRSCVKEIGEKEAVCEIITVSRSSREPFVDITLAQALLKGKNFDLVVEKGTELGVNKIIPVISENVIRNSVNMRRLNEIARNSMKQCARAYLPEIKYPVKFTDLIVDQGSYDIKLMPFERGERKTINTVIAEGEFRKYLKRALILTGPEGGFTTEEVKLAEKHNFIPVYLGPRRLRAETASIVAVTLLLAIFEEL